MQSAYPTEARSSKTLYLLIAACVFIAAFFKIADLDFWWHLKTGQVIWQTHAFQYKEIYSFTANGREYIDHEWLFQVILYFFYSLAGPAGVILFKCATLILIYMLLGRYLLHNGASPSVAMCILLLSICGARMRFIERPELFTILYLVLTYLILDHALRTGRIKLMLILPILSVVWVNTHAAVILGLLLQFTFLFGSLAERNFALLKIPSAYEPKGKTHFVMLIVLVLSLVATGLNPYGYRVLKVPFELTSIINSGLLNNQEWQRPTPRSVPFFYLCLAFVCLSMIVHRKKFHLVNTIFSVFLAYISLRYVRNVGLFCVFMPLFVAPFGSAYSKRRAVAAMGIAFFGICLMYLMSVQVFEWGIGEASYFPDKIVRFTKQYDLRGNMINSYGFGGYLIWSLYPERRIFIDGRNEVYLPLLKKLIQMRGDNLSWNRLLEEYQIQYALLNYVDDLETVTQFDRSGHSTIIKASFTSTHFPKSRWALVYFDDDGMIFIRRSGVDQNLLNLEYTSVYPEGRMYQLMLARSGKVDVPKSIQELEGKLSQDPGCKRAQEMLHAMKEMQ